MDFNARQYDPQIGRFLSLDPLAAVGDQDRFSPYAAMGDEPAGLVDPGGMGFGPPRIVPFVTSVPTFSSPSLNGLGGGLMWMPMGDAGAAFGQANMDYYGQKILEDQDKTKGNNGNNSGDGNVVNNGSNNGGQESKNGNGSGGMKSASNYDYSKSALSNKETDDWSYILNGKDGNYFSRYWNILKRDWKASSTDQKVGFWASFIVVGGREEPSFEEFDYHPRLEMQTDKYHNFPSSFDKHIIENGYHSQRIIDRANWYELPGSINETEGIYQIGVNQNNVIFHRHFVPFFSY